MMTQLHRYLTQINFDSFRVAAIEKVETGMTALTINQFLQQIETTDDDNTVIRSLRIWIGDKLQ
jgi:hypothetical protein